MPHPCDAFVFCRKGGLPRMPGARILTASFAARVGCSDRCFSSLPTFPDGPYTCRARIALCPSLGTCYRICVRIIARSTLTRFIDNLGGHKDQRAVKAALDSWYQEQNGPTGRIRPISKRVTSTPALLALTAWSSTSKGTLIAWLLLSTTGAESSSSSGSELIGNMTRSTLGPVEYEPETDQD